MFDLEKFKTGKYYVHLPTQELYDEAMKFLDENGFTFRDRTKLTKENSWGTYKENTILKYFPERYHPKGVVFANSKQIYLIEQSLMLELKELPINQPKNEQIERIMKLFEEENDNNMVESPNHYIGELGLEVEEVLRNFIGRYEDGYVAHRMASAIEYILRSPLKNGTQDLEKAGYNIQQALEHIKRENEDG